MQGLVPADIDNERCEVVGLSSKRAKASSPSRPPVSASTRMVSLSFVLGELVLKEHDVHKLGIVSSNT